MYVSDTDISSNIFSLAAAFLSQKEYHYSHGLFSCGDMYMCS